MLRYEDLTSGAFPQNLPSPIETKVYVEYEKIGGCKNSTHVFYHHDEYGGVGTFHLDEGKKLDVFVYFFDCLFVCLSDF